MITALTILCSTSTVPLSIDSDASLIAGSFEQVIHLPGNLIGNWDAKTNPDGTMTRPGLWGGSGNQPIDCELEPILGGPYKGACSGAMAIDLDASASQMTLENLRISAFEEVAASFPLSIGVLFETFRTFQPDSLFIGNIPIEIPLANGSITSMRMEQVTALTIELVPDGAERWTFSTDVPVLVTIEAVIMGNPTGPLSIASILSLNGSIEIGGKNLDFEASASWESEETVDDPPFAFEDAPLEVPTILPPGQTSHLLLSADADSATSINSGTIFLLAHGETTLPGDVDGDGVVGVSDLLAVMAAWGTCAGCSEDIDDDGFVDVSDLLTVIANWS